LLLPCALQMLSWCRDQILVSLWQLLSCPCGMPSDTRGRLTSAMWSTSLSAVASDDRPNGRWCCRSIRSW
jgi:hypothetical protein